MAAVSEIPVLISLSAPWKRRAKCVRLPQPIALHLFFPEQYDRALINAAKTFCHVKCPVIHECLEHAVAMGEKGIWGGTSERERRSLRKMLMETGLYELPEDDTPDDTPDTEVDADAGPLDDGAPDLDGSPSRGLRSEHHPRGQVAVG